jgi:hypothetical protein
VETIQRLDEARKSGPKDAVVALSAQLLELKNVLQTFRESVLLLDEVDMVLHPLKVNDIRVFLSYCAYLSELDAISRITLQHVRI